MSQSIRQTFFKKTYSGWICLTTGHCIWLLEYFQRDHCLLWKFADFCKRLDVGYPTPQIPNSLGDKFSHWDSQNETRITHNEKKKNRDHAKCFLFWENHVSLRIYLIQL